MSGSSSKRTNTSDAHRSDEIIKTLIRETSKKLGCKSKKTKSNKAIKKSSNSRRPKEISTIVAIKVEPKLEETDSEDDLPLAIRLSNEHIKKPQDVIFPHITSKNWNKFERKLKEKELDEVTKKLNLCLAKMHGFEVYDSHFSSLHFVRLAIVDCLMNRKWNNLLKLVIMLSRNYSDPVFTMLIRHLCQILKHYHPAIRNTEFEDQIDLIVDKYDQKRDNRTNVNNTV